MNELYQIDESYYYVYEHWLNGQVIYVGKGKENRAVELRRNNYWKETVKDDFFNLKVVIKAYFKDEKDAFDYEKILIHRHLKNNQPLTNIEYGNIEPGFGYEITNTKKEINIKVMNEMKFFRESEVTKIIEKNIKDNGKVILFSSGFNRCLIHLVERINNVKLLELSISKTKNTKSKNSFIEKGIVPEPYNVIIFPTEILSLSKLKIVDKKVKSVIINDKFIDKNIVLQKLNKDLESLYLKRSPENIMNEGISPKIVKSYLNRQLTTSDKNDLCEELNIINDRGTCKKWPSVKKDLKKLGYKINEETIRIDGKQMRVSTIIEPEDIDLVIKRTKDESLIVKEIKVPKIYLNKQLTTSDKSDLCEELNIINDRGTHKRWGSIKGIFKKSGYKVEDETIRLDGKKIIVSTIIAPKDIDLVIKRTKDESLIVKNIEVPKNYLSRHLTTSEKRELCEELNITNKRGTTYKRWVSIKGELQKLGYKINDETIRVDGKQMRVSTIIAPEDN